MTDKTNTPEKSKSSKILCFIGWILIILQIINIYGVCKSKELDVGLFPNKKIYQYSYHTEPERRNIKIGDAFFAIIAGLDRYKTGFSDAYRELSHSIEEMRHSHDSLDDDYYLRTHTVIQLTSELIRETLGCNDEYSFSLFVYDTILLLSYGFLGIIGLVLAGKSKKVSFLDNTLDVKSET